jgi:hypothetical protein
MPPILAQSVVEYGGAASAGATSALSVIAEQFNTIYYSVSNSVSDHPMLWGAGVCAVAWLLIRPRR